MDRSIDLGRRSLDKRSLSCKRIFSLFAFSFAITSECTRNARSINESWNCCFEVFTATFSQLFRCRFKSSILGALTFSASHRVWFRHGLTSSYTHAHAHTHAHEIQLAFDFTFHFTVHVLYLATLFAEVNVRTSNSFVSHSNEAFRSRGEKNCENGYRVFILADKRNHPCQVARVITGRSSVCQHTFIAIYDKSNYYLSASSISSILRILDAQDCEYLLPCLPLFF